MERTIWKTENWVKTNVGTREWLKILPGGKMNKQVDEYLVPAHVIPT
jgi:hypothetical protein